MTFIVDVKNDLNSFDAKNDRLIITSKTRVTWYFLGCTININVKSKDHVSQQIQFPICLAYTL